MSKIVLGLLMGISLLFGTGLDEMFAQVEKLKVQMGGYTIGHPLNDIQWKSAQKNPEDADVPGTYKFKDGDYHIVIDDASKRVLVVYRIYNTSNRESLKKTIGSMMMDFEEPTTMTHGKILYWFYNHKGKMSQTDLDDLKGGIKSGATLMEALNSSGNNKQDDKPIVSLKLSSDIAIMPNTDPHKPAPVEAESKNEIANFYVIAASEAILQHYVKDE